MTFHSKKILLIMTALLLSACSFLDLKTMLEKDMAGKNLNSRLAVLEEACTTHARNHHGREIENSDGGDTQYRLSRVCHDMSIKITEANRTSKPQAKKAFSDLVAQCYEEGKYSLFNKDQQGTKTAPFHRPEDKRNLAHDTEVICSLYQKEFDRAVKRKSK